MAKLTVRQRVLLWLAARAMDVATVLARAAGSRVTREHWDADA